MINKEFLIWFSGFMDGEGSWRIKKHGISGRKKRQYFHLEMKVSNTHKESIDRINKEIPGTIFKIKEKNNSREKYVWQLTSKEQVISLTRKMLPYLVTKREIAGVIIRFKKMDNSNRWDKRIIKKNSEIYALQSKLREESLKINQRGNKK